MKSVLVFLIVFFMIAASGKIVLWMCDGNYGMAAFFWLLGNTFNQMVKEVAE